MERSQEDNDRGHHGSVKNQEGDLVVRKAATETTFELCDAEGASNENRYGRYGECYVVSHFISHFYTLEKWSECQQLAYQLRNL